MLYIRTAIVILAVGGADAFALAPCASPRHHMSRATALMRAPVTPSPPAGFVWADIDKDDTVVGGIVAETSPSTAETSPATAETGPATPESSSQSSDARPKAAAPKPKAEAKAKPMKRELWREGIFAPGVLAAKAVLGEQQLKELRASVIGKHSKVIADFVDTSESKFGQLVLRRMFEYADKDGNGTLDREEVKAALLDLGFDFVDDKTVGTMMNKFDADKNEVIDFEEFVLNTPRTLRTNLVKLAKKNGHDLGFLV